jgi:hypothetical protein
VSGRPDSGESFDDYEARVKRYGWSWFRQDQSAIEVLERYGDVRARAFGLAAGFETVGTEVVYRAGERWVGGRPALHGRLVDEALRRGGLDPTGDARDAVPQAVFLLGLPGAGKSSMLRPVAGELLRRVTEASHVVVDTDIVRGLFPEYADGLGSEVVQPETSFVANRLLLDEAYRLRVNVILDKVGDPDDTVAELRYLVRSGWSVWCLCARIDVERASARTRSRALESGRYVPPDLIRAIGERPIRAYEAVRESDVPVSGCALLDTDVPPGRPPIVLDARPEGLFGSSGDHVTVWPRPVAPPDDQGVPSPW